MSKSVLPSRTRRSHDPSELHETSCAFVLSMCDEIRTELPLSFLLFLLQETVYREKHRNSIELKPITTNLSVGVERGLAEGSLVYEWNSIGLNLIHVLQGQRKSIARQEGNGFSSARHENITALDQDGIRSSRSLTCVPLNSRRS
ncbi:hypothetical protein EVAR_45954_1 [Eumeta japonica]|uniref:Uncharacterized protein n=1 Tax=Eumeta variegata TaxID=151549 RepID=A0A4C1YLI8_EUMVA|nr:hypothetical protein EVAR_45954_1 [Eumeta japonica]